MMIYAVVRLQRSDVTDVDMDLKEVRLFAEKNDAYECIKQEFDKEKAELIDNSDARFNAFDGFTASIYSYDTGLTMDEWHLCLRSVVDKGDLL